MLSYLKSKRGKSPAPTQTKEPVLTTEDEEFIQRITSEAVAPADVSLPPTPPARPQFLQDAELEEAEPLALVKSNRDTEDTKNEFGVHQDPSDTSAGHASVKDKLNTARSKWNWGRKDSRDAKRQATASDLMSAAENVKARESDDDTDEEAKKEAREMADALEGLNLAAVDNRVFSISKETTELLAKYVLHVTYLHSPHHTTAFGGFIIGRW